MKKLSLIQLAILRRKFTYSAALNKWCARVTPVEWIYLCNKYRRHIFICSSFEEVRMRAYIKTGTSLLDTVYLSHRFNPDDLK